MAYKMEDELESCRVDLKALTAIGDGAGLPLTHG
jgi:hypothetical protein